jgi:FtsH-binding integral membrane protein
VRVQVRHPLAVLAFVAATLVFMGLVFLSLAFVVAVVAPVAGLAYLAVRLRVAVSLWRSRGRLPTAGGMQLIGPRRAQGLAAAEVFSGLAGLGLSCVPAFAVLGHAWAAIATGAAAFVVGGAAGRARARALANLQTVEVLPPEG